jgi:hypothetical protein
MRITTLTRDPIAVAIAPAPRNGRTRVYMGLPFNENGSRTP